MNGDAGLSGLILLISIGALFALMLARQIPLQIIGRFLSAVFRPVGRLFRLGRSGAESASPGLMGPSAWSPIARAFRHKTDTEEALGSDFSHEDRHLKPHGLLFRWLGVSVGYMQVPQELTEAVAEDYYQRGRAFLNGRVPIFANPQNLYEDEEGAILARYFESDAGCQYLLNEMRKTINANVRKLTVVFSTIISTVLIVNLLYNSGGLFDFANALGVTEAISLGAVSISLEEFNRTAFGLASILGGAFAMWVIYFVEYAPYQRNNFRELSNFVTRYLARLNDHFRTAAGQARSVTVGQETDAAKFSVSARKWHTNVLWLGFRIFFIEANVRNIMFQMMRNSGYYLVFVPAAFLIVLAAMNYWLTATTGFDAGARIADLGVIFAILFIVMLFIYVTFLRGSMKSIEEINQDEWIGFDSLLLENVLGEIVGKYAEDVGYWKNRIGGGF